MSKLSKKIITESWFSVDYILFDNDAKLVLDESTFKSYVSAKGSLISNLIECYQILNYEPGTSVYKTVSEMFDYIGDKVDEIRDDVLDLMTTEDSMTYIREEISDIKADQKNMTIEEAAKKVVTKRYKCSVIDAILLNDAMLAVEDNSIFESFDFKILIDAHKLLRDSLIATFVKQ